MKLKVSSNYINIYILFFIFVFVFSSCATNKIIANDKSEFEYRKGKALVKINSDNLTEVYFNSDPNEKYKETEEEIQITNYTNKEDKTPVIPEHIDGKPVTSIASSAFQNKGLEAVTIPHTVKVIGSCAFKDNKIVSVIIPNSVVTIGKEAFQNNKLHNLKIPDSVSIIKQDAFTKNRLSFVIVPSKTKIYGEIFDDNVVRGNKRKFTD